MAAFGPSMRRSTPPTVQEPAKASAGSSPAPTRPLNPSDGDVSPGIRVAADWAWRLVLLGGTVWLLFRVLSHFSEVTVPVSVALLLTALLHPVVKRLVSWRVPRALAVVGSMLLMVLVIAGSFTLIGSQVAEQAPELAAKSIEGSRHLVTWLATGPLHISDAQLNTYLDQAANALKNSQATIAKSLAEVGSGVGRFFAGLAIALFSTFFFLLQGRAIWTSLIGILPRRGRERTDTAALKGWVSLTAFVRATIIVALFDAVLITVGALVIGVPLAIAIGTLVFFGAFIPLLGAAVSGFVAVLVALVSINWFWALIMLAIIVAVMQIEGHVLQPLLLGRAVSIHPLAVLLGITVGVIVGGIVGALFAVPLIAFLNAFIRSLDDAPTVPLPPSKERDGLAVPTEP